MRVYLVGGATRDILMGIAPKDYDFVVVGATEDDFKEWKTVGKDFPIFLEPTHGWEVALARTERKTGTGYNGFTVECNGVTLEEDLARRDLTMNSIAIEVDFAASVVVGEPVTIGTYIDPFNGRQDIEDKILRHTTTAYKEDSLRVLRTARFLARLGEDWYIAQETKLLMADIYYSGELLHLTPERVFLETEKALGEKTPSLYFETLRPYESVFPYSQDMYCTNKTNQHHPERDVFQHCKMVMDYAAKCFKDPEIVWACYWHDCAKPKCFIERGTLHGHEGESVPLIEEYCVKNKVPTRYKNLALIVGEFHGRVHNSLGRDTNKGMKPASIMRLFEKTAALNKPERFLKMLCCCEADSRGRGVDNGVGVHYEHTKEYFLNKPYPQRQYLTECLEAVENLNTKHISTKMLQDGKVGAIIGASIREAKIKAIRGVYNKWK